MTSDSPLEIEVKIAVGDPTALHAALAAHGFTPAGERHFERNTVWDRPDGELRRSGRLLRLREVGGRCILTVKRPTAGDPAYKTLEEVEFIVSAAGPAAAALEILGYRPVFRYEKYRRVFRRPGCLVMLDETPIGVFLEIEAAPAEIDAAAAELGYSRADYITRNYLELFRAAGHEGSMVFPA